MVQNQEVALNHIRFTSPEPHFWNRPQCTGDSATPVDSWSHLLGSPWEATSLWCWVLMDPLCTSHGAISKYSKCSFTSHYQFFLLYPGIISVICGFLFHRSSHSTQVYYTPLSVCLSECFWVTVLSTQRQLAGSTLTFDEPLVCPLWACISSRKLIQTSSSCRENHCKRLTNLVLFFFLWTCICQLSFLLQLVPLLDDEKLLFPNRLCLLEAVVFESRK